MIRENDRVDDVVIVIVVVGIVIVVVGIVVIVVIVVVIVVVIAFPISDRDEMRDWPSYKSQFAGLSLVHPLFQVIPV